MHGNEREAAIPKEILMSKIRRWNVWIIIANGLVFMSLLFAAATPQETVAPARSSGAPRFETVQAGLFGLSGGQPNCWADYDGDGDLDLFVGMKGNSPNKLYRNDNGTFREVATEAGVADALDTRGAGWGDFDNDGDIDLYVGFSKRAGVPNKLYRNDGDGRHFTEMAPVMRVDVSGFETRQVSWLDFDNDGRTDLFVAFRDGPNMLFHNEGNHFRDVAREMGVGDVRRTVGAVWFDYNQDGRLDLFVANQDGDKNGMWRNDGTRFLDVAAELDMEGNVPGRIGSNGPSVIDFDNDGFFDLFVAGYGRNFLYRNDRHGKFTEVAEALGVAGGDRATPSAWGDFDNDGRPDLYVSSYIDKPVNERDYLYRNTGTRFIDVMPENLRGHGATHGIQWADFNMDGALDLSVANNNPDGRNALYRNLLPPDQARRSLEVMVLDSKGRANRAGAEVRLYAAGTRRVIGSRLVDTGSGYTSQSQAPVHFGLGGAGRVDIEVTYFTPEGRKIHMMHNVDPTKLPSRVLAIKVPFP
jgi:penicillin G amidase